MKDSYSSKPLIAAGWLRTILYVLSLAVTISIALILYLISLPGHALDIAILKKLDPGIISLLLFVLCFFITFVFRRRIDRKSFVSLGFRFKGYAYDAIAGGSLAIFIVCSSAILLKVTGHLKWMDIIFDPKALFMTFGTVILIAFSEELVFRGYILSNLLDSFPKWVALTISALLFMFFHWTSIGFFPLVNHLILGLILGINFIYTRNLWFSICFHIGWKFFEGPVLGFSGDESFQTLLQTELSGDEKITGGVSGLEGSFILLTVSILSLLALVLFLRHKLNPQSQPVPGQI